MAKAQGLNRTLTLLAALTLALTMANRAGAQVSLSTVVDLAQRNSSAVRIADASLQRARATQAEVRDAVLPTAQFATGLPAFPSSGFTGSVPSIFTVSTQTVLYSVPQHRYISAAGYGAKAAYNMLKDAREQVALDAAVAYLELDTTQQNLTSVQQQKDLAARLVEIETKRTEAGVDPLSELLQAKLTAAQLQLRYEQLSSRAEELAKQLSILTGLPNGSITIDHASIPAMPAIKGDEISRKTAAVKASEFQALSKAAKARGDSQLKYLPQLVFAMQYSRSTTLLNSVNYYFAHPLPINNYSSGISVQIPLFDMTAHARARESAAEALQAKVEAEESQHKNDQQIELLNRNLRQLNAMAEVSSLKQQIAAEQLKSVLAQLELGNGSSAQPQLSPKAEQQARIEERNKAQDAADSAFELARAKLSLLRALGHMQDWLRQIKEQ